MGIVSTILRFLRIGLVNVLAEILVALWRVVLSLVIAIWVIFAAILGRIRNLEKGSGQHSKKPRCTKVPEIVTRRPDPCIYSQSYLMALGMSVTWNNPDIWITSLDGTPVDSDRLLPSTHYLVHVRIHDASFDPALATEVRCFFRSWGFNSPGIMPVEVNPDGSAKTVVLNIPPWSNAVAQFKWRTPDHPGHYCLQAECRHADDMNSGNNVGQENTNVMAGELGQKFTARVMLFNEDARPQRFRIFVDCFSIPKTETTVLLKTARLPFRSSTRFDLLPRALLTFDAGQRKVRSMGSRGPFLIRYAYVGWDAVRKAATRGKSPLPREWRLRVGDGTPDERGWTQVEVPANTEQELELSLVVSSDAAHSEPRWLNFTATDELGKTVGGVTFKISARA